MNKTNTIIVVAIVLMALNIIYHVGSIINFVIEFHDYITLYYCLINIFILIVEGFTIFALFKARRYIKSFGSFI